MGRRTKDNRFTSLSPAVEQAVEILKYLASERQMKVSLTNIAKEVGIHKSKTQNILDALQIGGFVAKDEENKTYGLGIGLVPVGQKALENIDYRSVANPFLEKLARETKCTVHFGLISGQNLTIIAKKESGIGVDSIVSVGYTTKLFYRAHGKAILASLPKEEQKRLFSGDNFFDGGRLGIIDNSKLMAEVKEIKKKGFAVDEGITGPGIQLLSTAVLGHKNYPIGAIVIIGLMRRSVISKNGARLVDAAKSLSGALGADRNNINISAMKFS